MLPEIYPWQERDWRDIRALAGAASGAILLYGPRGIGKLALARHLAVSLLCESPGASGGACGTCVACRWCASGAHPDWLRIRPEAVQVEEGLEADLEESAGEDEAAGERKSKRAPSREIRIEQVRAISQALTVGSHRGGRRVVLIYPAHALNQASSNALLKILEEPPAGTLFILVTDRAERLLPTVRSRCRQLAARAPDAASALAWLSAQGVTDPAGLLAAHGGAPLAALASANDAEAIEPVRRQLIDALCAPQAFSAIRTAERLNAIDNGIVVGWLLRWIHDCISLRLTGRIRYHPSESTRMASVVARAVPQRLLHYQRELIAQRRVAEHPLNKRLYLESVLLGYPGAVLGP